MTNETQDVTELYDNSSKIVESRSLTLNELIAKTQQEQFTSRDDGEPSLNSVIYQDNDLEDIDDFDSLDDQTFSKIVDEITEEQYNDFGTDPPIESDYISDEELKKAEEEANTQRYTQHDQLDLENNLLRLYAKIIPPYVAINNSYTWYITNDPKRLPKDCERLTFPTTDDPTEQMGMVYLLDQTVVDAQGRTQRKIKIGYTNILRRRLMELQRSINRHNINKENSRVMAIFSTPHKNPAKTEKLLHKHFARYRHGTQEVFSISLAEAYAQLPTNTFMHGIQTLPCDIVPYTTTTLDNNLKLIHYEQDPQSRLIGIFEDILLQYPAEHIISKYHLTQQELLRIINSEDYRAIALEYRDMYTLQGMTRFKADKLKLQLIDKAIEVLDRTEPSASDILRLSQMHRELTKDMVVVNNRLRKSTVPPPTHKLTNIDDLEILPAIDIGSY